jgi:hypothetical protein
MITKRLFLEVLTDTAVAAATPAVAGPVRFDFETGDLQGCKVPIGMNE